jgi:hypothetical protein
MPRTLNLQTNFNSGLLDPRLHARTDIKHYYQGAAEATNVVSSPQGGLKRRPGLRYIDETLGVARLAAFAFNVEQNYLMVFTENNIAVYKDDVWQADITTTYAESELFELNWTQSADTMIIVHENHAPATLVRGATHSSWTLSDITFDIKPTYDFEQDYDAITFTIGTGAETADKVGSSVTVTASSSIFTAADVGGYFESLDGGNPGIGRITAYASGTSVTIEVLEAWENATGNSVIGTKVLFEEPVWTATHGWPKTVTFHEGRLYFGGSTSRPQTVWGSKSNDFYNFDRGTGLDDDSIDITLDTDQVNAIRAIFAGRHLQIFTSGGEFYIPDSPITPAASTVKRQTLFGSGLIPPKSIDGATFFIDRTGKAVREYLYTYTEEAYTAPTVSLLATHILNSPVDMDVLRGSPDDDANYLYLVNGDGTVAVFNTLRAQEVGGWSYWQTAGQVESVAVVFDEVYFVVKRTIDGTDYRFIEEADKTYYMDCSVKQTYGSPTATITGLDHLDGEECRVKADGAVMTNATPASGSITLVRTASEVEVGLDFDIQIKTMPMNIDLADGPSLTRKKRITRVVLDLYQSLGVFVNGKRIPDRQFGTGILNNVPQPFTGIEEIYLNGWDRLAQVTITQQDPLPFMILGLAIEVEV